MDELGRQGHSERPATAAGVMAEAAAHPLGDATPDLDWSHVMALAWRPAWSIRSRRGAWTALCALLRGRRQS